ncbi:hypothetical protein ES703_99349 [subsurface metagenome]
MLRKNLYAMSVVVIVLVVFVLLFLWLSQKPSDQYQPEQDSLEQYQKYSDLLKGDVLLKTRRGITPYAGLPDPGPAVVERLSYVRDYVVAVKGLDSPDAVPFLIDVLQNGPNWPDERLMTGVYPHLTRCYAALLLGASKDSRALEPLIGALRTVDPNEKREYLACYASRGLGMLGDPKAVDALIDALRDDRPAVRGSSAHALGTIRDITAVKPLIEAFEDSPLSTHGTLVSTLKRILKLKFKYQFLDRRTKVVIEEFPELGTMEFLDHFERLWRHWWKVEPEFTKQRFEKYYREWKRVVEEKPQAHSAHSYRQNKMLQAGIPALPFLIEKVKKGDIGLIKTISELTNRELKKTATQKQCLEWWNKNKHKWLIPFEETLTNPASGVQNGNEPAG